MPPQWKWSPGMNHLYLFTPPGMTVGRPRGVVLTHANNFFNTLNYSKRLPDGRRAMLSLPLTPMFHSSTLGRIVTYVFNGVTFITSRSL